MMILSKERKRHHRHSSYVTLFSDIIDAEPSSYEEVAKKKGKENTSSRRMISRIRYLQVDGNIVRYKARFIARGFRRKEGIDYEETFAATRS